MLTDGRGGWGRGGGGGGGVWWCRGGVEEIMIVSY